MVGKTNALTNANNTFEELFYNAFFLTGTGASTVFFNSDATSLTKGARYDEFFSGIANNKITALKNCKLDLTLMTQIGSDTASYTNNYLYLYITRAATNSTTELGHVAGNRSTYRCLNIPDVEIFAGDLLSGSMTHSHNVNTSYALLGILKGG